MSDQTKQATLNELYVILNQLVEAYTEVMKMFQNVVLEVGDIKSAVEEIRTFVNNEYSDAVMARDVWRHSAELHKHQAEDLRDKLKSLEDVAAHIGRITEHPHFVAAKSRELSASIAEKQPSDFKVVINDTEGHSLTVVDESLDA